MCVPPFPKYLPEFNSVSSKDHMGVAACIQKEYRKRKHNKKEKKQYEEDIFI